MSLFKKKKVKYKLISYRVKTPAVVTAMPIVNIVRRITFTLENSVNRISTVYELQTEQRD